MTDGKNFVGITDLKSNVLIEYRVPVLPDNGPTPPSPAVVSQADCARLPEALRSLVRMAGQSAAFK